MKVCSIKLEELPSTLGVIVLIAEERLLIVKPLFQIKRIVKKYLGELVNERLIEVQNEKSIIEIKRRSTCR